MFSAGHSQGTTTALAAFAEDPGLAAKVSAAALLAPAAFLQHLASPPIRELATLDTDTVRVHLACDRLVNPLACTPAVYTAPALCLGVGSFPSAAVCSCQSSITCFDDVLDDFTKDLIKQRLVDLALATRPSMQGQSAECRVQSAECSQRVTSSKQYLALLNQALGVHALGLLHVSPGQVFNTLGLKELLPNDPTFSAVTARLCTAEAAYCIQVSNFVPGKIREDDHMVTTSKYDHIQET